MMCHKIPLEKVDFASTFINPEVFQKTHCFFSQTLGLVFILFNDLPHQPSRLKWKNTILHMLFNFSKCPLEGITNNMFGINHWKELRKEIKSFLHWWKMNVHPDRQTLYQFSFYPSSLKYSNQHIVSFNCISPSSKHNQ